MTTSIKTETSAQWQIPNQQNLFLHGNEDLLKQHFIKEYAAIARTGPTGIYNCHGLTFAARRTCLDDGQSINQILKHDGYVLVPAACVMPGDIVLYFADGVITHSGIVVEVPSTQPKLPKIVSKWGTSGGEYIHWVHRSPYGSDYNFYRVDRTEEAESFTQLSKLIIVE